MKTPFSIYLLLLCGYCLTSGAPTKELDPQLLEIYELMQSNDGKKELKDEEFEVDLTIKHATEKFLVFSDAYLQADEETKYQIGKWIFTPQQTKGLEGKRGMVCRVRFLVEEVRTELYPDMPHILAKIISLELLPPTVEPSGAGQPDNRPGKS